MHEEKEKIEQKKGCSCCEDFLQSRVYDWFDSTYSKNKRIVKKKNCQFPTTTKKSYGHTYHRQTR